MSSVAFPSLHALTAADRVIVQLALSELDQPVVLGRHRAGRGVLAALVAALNALPRPAVVELDTVADLDEAELEWLCAGAAGQRARARARGDEAQAAFFGDLFRGLRAERRRRRAVLATVLAALREDD